MMKISVQTCGQTTRQKPEPKEETKHLEEERKGKAKVKLNYVRWTD